MYVPNILARSNTVRIKLLAILLVLTFLSATAALPSPVSAQILPSTVTVRATAHMGFALFPTLTCTSASLTHNGVTYRGSVSHNPLLNTCTASFSNVRLVGIPGVRGNISIQGFTSWGWGRTHRQVTTAWSAARPTFGSTLNIGWFRLN